MAHGKNKETCRQATIKQDFRNVSGWGVGVPGASGDGERGGAGGWAQKRVGGN